MCIQLKSVGEDSPSDGPYIVQTDEIVVCSDGTHKHHVIVTAGYKTEGYWIVNGRTTGAVTHWAEWPKPVRD